MAGQDDATGRQDPSGPSTSLLAELSEDTRAALLAAATRIYLPAGEWLFRHGDPADAMYLLESGRVEVLDSAEPRGPGGTVLRVLGPGSSLGEVALLTRSTRSASARARRDTVLLRLDVASFEALLTAKPGLTLALTRAMGRWLARADRPRSISRVTVLALISPNPALPLQTLGEHVMRALRSIGPSRRVAVVTADEARAQLTDAGLGGRTSDVDLGSVFGGLLDRWEKQHDMVILGVPAADSGDREARAWTDFCLRSADRAVIVIGPADRAEAWAETVDRMRSALPGRPDLCFLGTREPAQVAGWLDALSPRAHHFVRTETTRDAEETVGRMIRRVTGRSVGVVLSGGGARGFCHLGVLASFRAAGIPIDRVGGCSIGAIIAALFASGHSDEEAVEVCRRFFVSSNPLNDFVLPRTALLRGRKLRASLRAALGLDPIEVLTLPYYCTSADLVRAEAVVHRRGPLWKAVLASVSIPGLLPPVPVGEQLLVDGGVLNNLPIDVMADTDEGPVVAVDVMRPFTGRRAAPAATRSLRSRRRAADERDDALPPIAEILTRVSVLGSWRAVEQSRPRAILTVTVPDTGTGMLEWNRLDAMVDVGRHAAEAALQDPASAPLRAAIAPPPSQ